MATSARIPDRNGWWEISDNPISKVGVFQYSGRFISPDLDPNQLYFVLRPAEELSDPDCLDSFKLVPWTNDHPSRLLGTGDGAIKPEEKGIEGVIGERVYFDDADSMIKANIKVFSKSHADRITAGKEELSAGYQCKYEYNPGIWDGQEYQYIQREIRGNHLASVQNGRMGADVSVMDGFIFTIDHKEFKSMKKTNKIRSVLNTLIRYARDAEEGTNEMEAEEKSEIDQLQALIKKVAPLMQQIADLPTVMAKTEMEEEGTEAPEEDPLALAAKDSEEEEKKKKEEEEAKAAKDTKNPAPEDGKEKTGMDAKEVQAAIAEALKGHGMDAKDIMILVGKRDKLASQLSNFVGTFDASEMSLDDVAAYGVKKLGLPSIAGQDHAVLAGYLKDRQAPKAVVFGMDKKEGGSFIDSYLEHKEG